MTGADIEISMGTIRGQSLQNHLVDFANMLKAFIGANYLTIAFSFRQSGIGLGIAGLVIVATLTAHCCNLLVKCKYLAIRQILCNSKNSSMQHEADDHPESRGIMNSASYEQYNGSEGNEDDDKKILFKRLQRNLNYGDVGRLCFGSVGTALVNTAVMITQFGFCIGYYIFIGNTLQNSFPLYNCSTVVYNASFSGEVQNCFAAEQVSALNAVPMSGLPVADSLSPIELALLSERSLGSDTVTLVMQSRESGLAIPPPSFSMHETAEPPGLGEASASPNVWTNVTVWSLSRGKNVPDLKILVITPALLFIAMTLIRSVRRLGFISFLANVFIFVGCVEVFAFLVSGFRVSESYVWTNWKDLPIFFGMVTGAYEGIGTILPIEASMEGNRHNFVKFLYGAVALLTVVLSFFGIMGYLRFGQDVGQMINANIPSGQWLSIAVNSCLCLGVLLTFPLMVYPVVELAELYLFGSGRLCSPKSEEEKSGAHKSLLPKEEKNIHALLVAEKISESVPSWKRNCLRIFIVLSAGGLAVLLRNNFAYISAFVGALGSTVLAYILPCLFHLRLCWNDLPVHIVVKDVVIIAFGIGCGIAGVYSVLVQIVGSV